MEKLFENLSEEDLSIVKLMAKLITRLPEEDDFDLITLKGHLIVEQELVELLSRIVKLPLAVDDARLSFYQLSKLAKAHTFTDEGAWIWKALEKLNKVRNLYAHNLEPDEATGHIEDFIAIVESWIGEQHEGFAERYRKAISHLAANIRHYANQT